MSKIMPLRRFKWVTGVRVQGKLARMIDSMNFEAYVDVVKGTNVISVAAVNGSGNVRTNSYEVVVEDAGERVFSYDANGNTVSDGVRGYEWDGLDRLVKINYAGEGNYSEFVYDGLGRRVRMREVEGGVTVSDKRFVWDGLGIMEQRSADGVTVERRYYGQGFEQGGSSGGEAYFYVRDHLGSVRALVDESGEVRGRWDYSVWGVRGANQVTVDAVELDVGFTGHFEHVRSGLVLAPYRAYDAELARWLSRDPIGEDGGINLYGYVGNDPVNAVDPLGLDAVFLVGRNRKEPSYFTSKVKAVAASYEQQSGQKSHIFEVRTVSDIQVALATPNIDRLDYWGHGGGGVLFLSEGDEGSLLSSEVISLNRSNIKRGSVINLVSCYSSAGLNSNDGSDSIAQAFADHFLTKVGGFESGVSFGFPTKIGTFAPWFPRGYVGVRMPRKRLPIYQGPTMKGYEN